MRLASGLTTTPRLVQVTVAGARLGVSTCPLQSFLPKAAGADCQIAVPLNIKFLKDTWAFARLQDMELEELDFFICFRLLSFSLMNQTRDLLHKTHLNEMRSCAPCKLASTCKPVRRRARLSLEVAIFMPGRLVKPRRHHCHSCHVNCTTYLD